MGQLNLSRPTRVVLVIAGLWLAAYTAWTLSGPRDATLHNSVAALSLAFIQSLAAFFGFRVSSITTLDARLRSVWRWISRALTAVAVSGWVWFAFSVLNLNSLPWVLDVIYFFYYPCIMIAVFRFPFASSRSSERRIFWLDIAIIILATAIVFWAVNLHRFIEILQSQPLMLLGLVFPLSDAFLFAGVTALLQRDVEQVGHRSFIFLTIALGMNALAEGFYDFASVHLYEMAKPYIYILWLLGGFSFLIAAIVQINLEPPSRQIFPSRSRSLLRMILPYLGAVTGWITLIVMVFTSFQPDLRLQGVLLGSALMVVLVLWRQYNLLIENTHLYEEMQRLAITDSLTGLYNRHFFNEVLRRELLHAERYHTPLTLLLVDIDDFKLFNDTLGHLQGDKVLNLVSNVLNTQLRRVDLLSRFGGDEFAVIMPGTDQAGAVTASRRIQSVIAEYSYAEKQLGLSIGIANYTQGMKPEQLVEQADRELYRSKATKAARKTQPIIPKIS